MKVAHREKPNLSLGVKGLAFFILIQNKEWVLCAKGENSKGRSSGLYAGNIEIFLVTVRQV